MSDHRRQTTNRSGRDPRAETSKLAAAQQRPETGRPSLPDESTTRSAASLKDWVRPFEKLGPPHPSGADEGGKEAVRRSGLHASRARLQGELEVQRRRAAQAEARAREIEAALHRTEARLEEQRVAAIELRTMLDATEYRITTLEEEIGARDREAAALRTLHVEELVRLRAEHEATKVQFTEMRRASAAEQAQLAEALAGLQSDRDALADELAAVRRQLADRTGEYDRLREEAAESAAARTTLEARVQELCALRDEMEREALATARRIGALEADLEQMRERALTQAEQYRFAVTRAEAIEQDLAERAARVAELEARVCEMREAGAQRESELRERFEAAVAVLQRELDEARADAERAVGEAEQLRCAHASAQDRGATLEKELEAARAATIALEARCQELSRHHSEALAERERLEEIVARIETEQEDLRKRLAAACASAEEEHRALAEIRTLQEQTAARCQLLEQELQAATARAGEAEERALTWQNELAARLVDLNAADERAREADERNAVLLGRVETLETACAMLRQAQEETAAHAREQQAALAEAEEVRNRLLAQVEEIRRQRDDVGLRLADAERELEGVRQALAGQVAEREATLAAALADVKTLRVESETARRERDELLERLAAQERDGEAIRKALVEQLAEREVAITAALAEAERYKQQAEAGQIERQELLELLAVSEQEVEAVRQTLGEQLAEQAAALAAATGEVDVLRAAEEAGRREREELLGRLVSVEEELEAAGRNLASRMAEYDAALANRTSELEGLVAAHAERETQLQHDLSERESQLDAAREQLAAAAAVQAELAGRLAALESETAQAAEQIRALCAQRDEIQAQWDDARDAQRLLTEERDALRADIEQWRERVGRLTEEVDRLRHEAAEKEAAREAAVIEGQEATARMAELGCLLSAAQQREKVLQAATDELQELLLKEQAHAAALWSDLESQTRFRDALDSALAEARARIAELESALLREQRQRSEQDAAKLESAEAVPALRERIGALEARLAEAECERESLREQMNTLRALRDSLDRECEQLRRRVASAEDGDRQRGETARLQARIEDLERQHREAAQRHSSTVSSYMLELNQRSELLRQREVEIQKLNEQLSVLQATCDDAIAQLETARQERDLLELRMRESESARSLPPRLERASRETTGVLSSAAASASAPAQQEGHAVGLPAAEPVKQPARRVAEQRGQPITVIHLDDDVACQDAVRTVIGRFPHTQYTTAAQALGAEGRAGGQRLLAVNLLARSVEPIAAIADPARWGIDDPCAFVYCAYGGHGLIIGLADFFPHPFEPDACASRLLGRPGGLQRLLAVSEDVDMMNGLREVLGRVRCSTAIAFDGRQALDLVPMVKPEVVLIDLNLPKGEGLRVVSRLRAEPKTVDLSVAILWTAPLNVKEFTQSALRVVRETTLTPQDIGLALTRVVSSLELVIAADGDGVREAG